MTVGCFLIPRFSLIAAIGERKGMLTEPVALAPEAGAEQRVGDASGAAEAFGIHAGMGLAEALGRCPQLHLVAPDPERAEREWERVLRRLEGLGAEVESGRAGEAFCELDGLRGLWGPEPERVLAKLGTAVEMSCKLGGGPTRLCAFAAAGSARARRRPPVISPAAARSFLAAQPVGLLRWRLPRGARETERLVETFERLGIATLGDLAGLPRPALADRFGRLGLTAHELAGGLDTPLRPRSPHEELVASIALPEGSYGNQLTRALELLVERLLTDPERKGRVVRALRLEAKLAGGGSWRAGVTLRSATADAERIGLAAGAKLGELPAPASTLTLRAISLGDGAPPQPALAPDERERRRALIGEAVRQARAAGGRDAVMRVVDVDPDSRIPERRTMLAPHAPGEGGGGGSAT